MRSILPFDEINRLTLQVREWFADGKKLPKDREGLYDIIDMMLDLYLLAYAQANEVTNANLGAEWTPTVDEVMKVVNAEVAGKTWKERVEEYFADGGTVDDIVRIAETETHRIANTAALDTAKMVGAKKKTWVTMLDDKVRETHDYLEGVTVGIDDEFIAYDGDKASAPGQFSLASNNVNCRCELIFS